MAVAIQRRFRCRVARADDRDLLADIAIRLAVIVRHLGEIRAGDAEQVGLIEEADRHDHMTRPVLAAIRGQGEAVERTGDAEDALIEPDVQLFLRRHAAVLLDRIFARGLVALYGKGIAADLDQLGRREELHPRRIADQRVDQRSLVDHQRAQPLALRLDGARQTHRSRSHDHHIVHRVNGSTGARGRESGLGVVQGSRFRVQGSRGTRDANMPACVRPCAHRPIPDPWSLIPAWSTLPHGIFDWHALWTNLLEFGTFDHVTISLVERSSARSWSTSPDNNLDTIPRRPCSGG